MEEIGLVDWLNETPQKEIDMVGYSDTTFKLENKTIVYIKDEWLAEWDKIPTNTMVVLKKNQNQDNFDIAFNNEISRVEEEIKKNKNI